MTPFGASIIPWTGVFGPGDKLAAWLSCLAPARRRMRLTILSAVPLPTSQERINNGAFASGSNWTLGNGWSIGSGVATRTNTGTAGDITNDGNCVNGVNYVWSFEITAFTSGTVRMVLPGPSSGPTKNTVGIHTGSLVATGDGNPKLTASLGAALSIDNVSVVDASAVGAFCGVQLRIFRGSGRNGPWEASPWIGPILVSGAGMASSLVNGAAAAGATSIVVDDGSAFSVDRPIVLSPGTQTQQFRTIVGKSGNTLTLDWPLRVPVADNANVIQLHPWSLNIDPRGAGYLKVELTNVGASIDADAGVAVFASEVLGSEIL